MEGRVKRFLAALISLVSLTFAAYAAPFQPCPYVTSGWSQSWTGFNVTTALYDGNSALLYVIFFTTTATAYSNVPYSVAQGFSSSRNPDMYWQTSVAPSYHALLLAQTNNCPLRFETGAYIWSD